MRRKRREVESVDELKPIGKDATGYEVLTEAVKVLLNQFPGLYSDEEVKFEELGDESGLAFSANAGALIYSEKQDICGVYHQVCQYPFYLVYRTTSTKERQKMSIQEFLDTFGKWLCQEPCDIDGLTIDRPTYPGLGGGREIKRITRDNSYGLDPQENGVQDWVLPVSVQYTNKFKKIL